MNQGEEMLIYRNSTIRLVPDVRKNKPIVWIVVNNNVLSFVSNMAKARKIAVNFVDVVKGDGFMESKKNEGCIGKAFYGNA